MRPLLTSLAFVLALPFLATAQSASDLPRESAELIERMREWELSKRAELEEEIAKQRLELVDRLRIQMERHTKAGDLKTANAVLKEIEKLENSEGRPPSGFAYRFPWGRGQTVRVTFHEDRSATWENLTTNDTFERTFRWEVTGPRVVELWTQSKKKGQGTRWTFPEDFASARVRSRNDPNSIDATRVE